MLLDVPRFKCKVKREYLTDGERSGLEEAYVFAVTIIEARPLLWTVHTVAGAVYSRLPTQALVHDFGLEEDATSEALDRPDPWGAISSFGNVVAHEYLKDYEVLVREGSKTVAGLYLFTIDYERGGFAQDPEEFKTSNVIALYSGQICAVPNNHCQFLDRHFTDPGASTSHYRRTKTYYTVD